MLMSVQDLYEAQKNRNLVVFDCRFQLMDKAWGKQQYQSGHIEGAMHLDLEQDLSGIVCEHGGRHPIPDTHQFAMKLGNCGVDENATVVVYDSGQGVAARAWWLIRFLGHDSVFVLDGGLNAWMEAGYPLVKRVPVREAATFVPRVYSDWIVDYSQVREIAEKKQVGQLIDARAPERFRGDIEPIDKIAGHIPMAENAPWLDGIDKAGHWKSPDLQRKRFVHMELGETPLIVYCGSGVTACGTLFAMALAGLRGVKLYPGSWSDWVSYEDSPIAKGSEQP